MQDWHAYIVTDPDLLGGKPALKGTRLAVAFVLERLADGWTEAMLMENYPSLTAAHLQAVFAYLHHCIEDGVFTIKPHAVSR